MLRFIEAVAVRLPDDGAVLKSLGDLYTRLGFYAEGLDVDQRLSALCPQEPLVLYNLGCSFALTGNVNASLEALKRAISLGYDDLVFMARDEDLRSLRELAEFRDITGMDAPGSSL
ncbi:MAG: hypothetical protein WCL16_11305 [bacterium]